MSILRLGRLIHRTGRIAEPETPAPGTTTCPIAALRGSAQIRHVDAGSCNGCEIEIGQAFGPVYDAERYGAKLVASPRHADVILVTGVVTQSMKLALERTVEATPQPRLVVACGDCAVNGGLFLEGHAVAGIPADIVDVDLEIPGCPPSPEDIIAALRQVTGR